MARDQGNGATRGPAAYRQTNGCDSNQLQTTAHNWESEKNRSKDFYDDGTITFFWRAHRILVLVVFSLVLVYVALFEKQTDDVGHNTKRCLSLLD
jgi:phosphatidylserine synthase 2